MKKEIDTKPVWIAWTNTDLTEGRGRVIPKAVCQSEACAIRMGVKGSVMGGHCTVTESTAIYFNEQWLIPGVITPNMDVDDRAQEKINRKRAVVEKAKAAGLSEDEIKMLSYQ